MGCDAWEKATTSRPHDLGEGGLLRWDMIDVWVM